MRTACKTYSFFLVGALAFVALLTPTQVEAQEEVGTVEISAYHCLGLAVPGPLTNGLDDCVPGPASFDFYLYDDGTDDFQTIAVGDDGVASGTLPVGTYAVHETSWDTPVGDFEVTAEVPLVITWGIPRTDTPPVETGLLDVMTFECESVVGDPVILGEVAPDCVQVSSTLSFYLIGDGTDDFWPLTTSATEPTTIELPVGDYEVVNEATQGIVNLSVPAGSSAVLIGYPASAPDPEVGTLNINTIMCDNVVEPMVTDIVDDDCVRVAKNLSFYLVGDGTDDFIPVTTSSSDTTVVDLPIGDYEIVDEASQARLFVSVSTGTADLNIAYPWVDDDDDDDAPPVTDLPETGVGTGNSVGAIGAVFGVAMLAAGAIGVRVRNS